jgi:two-component system, LytTR family, response regulator
MTIHPFRYIIVDDNEIDQLMVYSYLKNYELFEFAGFFNDSSQVETFLKNEKIDIIFLDIDLNGESGIDLRKKLSEVPACIFITSHPEFALEGFALNALDYLVKPFDKERFNQTISRIRSYFEIREKAALYDSKVEGECIVIKEGYDQVKVPLKDILFLEALKDYTLVVTNKKKHCVLCNLGTMLKQECFSDFIRIHRSYAVAKSAIKRVGSSAIKTVTDVELPLGRSFKANIQL